MVDDSSDAIVVTNDAGIIQFCNKSIADLCVAAGRGCCHRRPLLPQTPCHPGAAASVCHRRPRLFACSPHPRFLLQVGVRLQRAAGQERVHFDGGPCCVTPQPVPAGGRGGGAGCAAGCYSPCMPCSLQPALRAVASCIVRNPAEPLFPLPLSPAPQRYKKTGQCTVMGTTRLVVGLHKEVRCCGR